MYKLVLIVMSVVNMSNTYAQTDTSTIVDPVIITNTAIRNITAGTQGEPLGQYEDQSNVQDLLNNTSNIYLKNYGAGSLTTSAIRGGSAGHTLVLWNGLPLASPTLGLLDLSLLGSIAADQATLTKGGNSTLWGSGAVSGTLDLRTIPAKDYTAKFSAQYGSFGQLGYTASLHTSNKTWLFSTQYQFEKSTRDFNYRLSPDLPLTKQENAVYNRHHFIQDIAFKWNRKNTLTANIWLQKAYTEIPATTTQTRSEANQNDNAIRGILTWKHIRKSSVWQTKIGVLLDENIFEDKPINISADNNYSTLFAESSGQWKVGKGHTVLSGVTYNNTSATTAGYEDGVSEARLAMFSSHKYVTDKLKLQTSARVELVDDNLLPVMPSLGLSWRPISVLNIRAKVSRDYRLPTLNDRYWLPGGNEDLLPESGWSQEVGIDLSSPIGSMVATFSSTAYHRLINNWILWAPSTTGPFWSANNINKVRSQGLEQQLKVSYSNGKHKLEIMGSYDYTLSTYEEGLQLPVINPGDQLIYTPVHSSLLAANYSFSGWELRYQHRLVGSVRGVNEDISKYNIGNLNIGYKTEVGGLRSTISISANNLWNTDYFIIERRPTPGRSWQLNFTIKH